MSEPRLPDLTRLLRAASPKRPRGRHGAKSDGLDAVRAGREALARDHLTNPRQRGRREALRVLHTTRAAIMAAGAGADAKQLETELRQLIVAVAPALLTQPGIGPINAALLLISWSHSGRFRSEAAFGMLAGAAPVQASSGQVLRHRLNRGGDRQLNRALPTIVMLRQVHHEPTRAYTSRRVVQGKSQREIRRCLKRTVARQLYRLLERTATNPADS